MSATEWKFVPVESDENMATAFFDRVTVTSRGGLIGIRSALNAAIAAAPVPPSVESLLEDWTPSDQKAFAKFRDEHFPGEMDSYAIQSLGSAWKNGQANAALSAEKICRTDGRCEYAIQIGAEGNGHCPDGNCAMPASAPGTGSDTLDCILGVGGFASYGPLDAQPAHLTIPGALEWDGDNGTHGADGESGVPAYTAVDMTTAAADGFRDGQTSANDSLKAFTNEMIGAAFDGGSFDGGDIQAFGVKHGLLQIEQRTEECGEVCACREYGFPAECYRKTDLLKPADEPVIEQEAFDDIPDFTPGNGNKAKRRIAAMEAAKLESFPCWSCSAPVTMEQRAAADGDCPHCAAELDLEDWPNTKTGCAYEVGDWACREGGYLWYAGDGEGWDPEDCTHICPHCRTKDYLESAKEDAESCSSYSNPGSSGTGLDIWTAAEKTALTANHPAACKALAEIGPVSALDGEDVVICNTQQVVRDQAAKGGEQ